MGLQQGGINGPDQGHRSRISRWTFLQEVASKFSLPDTDEGTVLTKFPKANQHPSHCILPALKSHYEAPTVDQIWDKWARVATAGGRPLPSGSMESCGGCSTRLWPIGLTLRCPHGFVLCHSTGQDRHDSPSPISSPTPDLPTSRKTFAHVTPKPKSRVP